MRQATTTLTVPTRGKGLHEFTREAVRWTAEQEIGTGLLTVFIRHTSASLLIQENADADVRTDLSAWFEEIAPEAPGRYVHADEGHDDMPAHLRAAVTPVSLSIPVVGGRPVLGTWQGLYVFEHRRAPNRRQVVLHLIGE
jgi:secondary thiamine-phosphate synthase enzyme